uniref:Uncharacterized protein n=1 Tax=Romanomermis culicivorax TaxID=13658 RepID=A0A915HPQ5_ROMCU
MIDCATNTANQFAIFMHTSFHYSVDETRSTNSCEPFKIVLKCIQKTQIMYHHQKRVATREMKQKVKKERKSNKNTNIKVEKTITKDLHSLLHIEKMKTMTVERIDMVNIDQTNAPESIITNDTLLNRNANT